MRAAIIGGVIGLVLAGGGAVTAQSRSSTDRLIDAMVAELDALQDTVRDLEVSQLEQNAEIARLEHKIIMLDLRTP